MKLSPTLVRGSLLILIVVLFTQCSDSSKSNKVESVHRSEPVVKNDLLWPEGHVNNKVDGKNTQHAQLTYYLPPSDKFTGTAVVICPGGGYRGWAMNECHKVAKWFNSFGVAGIILKYRLKKNGPCHPMPLDDAQRAIQRVRYEAPSLGIHPNRIGIIGFSAGGHLASTAGTQFTYGDSTSSDPIAQLNSRPDFMILCYPVIAFDEKFTHKGSQRSLLGKNASTELLRKFSSEKQIKAETPSTFLFHTVEDKLVRIANSEVMHQALLNAGVKSHFEKHQKGRHGVGLAQNIEGTREWTNNLKKWLVAENFLTLK